MDIENKYLSNSEIPLSSKRENLYNANKENEINYSYKSSSQFDSQKQMITNNLNNVDPLLNSFDAKWDQIINPNKNQIKQQNIYKTNKARQFNNEFDKENISLGSFNIDKNQKNGKNTEIYKNIYHDKLLLEKELAELNEQEKQ